jgi:hypothetical protein
LRTFGLQSQSHLSALSSKYCSIRPSNPTSQRRLKQGNRAKYWEIIADNLSKAGWSWGCVSAIDSNGRTIWIADAQRDDGKRFVVRADEKLTAFLELESFRSNENR